MQFNPDDVSIFKVQTQTKKELDQLNLLCIQDFIRNNSNPYTYLEIGSYRGGSLYPHLIDPFCESVVSIDLRPLTIPDIRKNGEHRINKNNTTKIMMQALEAVVSKEDLLKLKTYDIDASDYKYFAKNIKIDLSFIDGEHTIEAVCSDFNNILPYMKTNSIVIFHDSNLVYEAFEIIKEELTNDFIKFESYYLPETIFILVFGDYIESSKNLFSVKSIPKIA